jgi:hypothetical protein
MKKVLITLAVVAISIVSYLSYKTNEKLKANEAKIIKELEAQEFENNRHVNRSTHVNSFKLDRTSSGLDVAKIDHEIDSVSMLIK